MILNFLLITFRSMMKNRLFIVINVSGMGIAIAICIVSYFAYEYDLTFDATHKNKDSIYRVSSVREFDNTLTRFGHTSLPLAEVVDKTFQDVDRSSPYLNSHSNFKLEDNLFASNVSYVDPEFFQMFSFDFIAGDGKGLSDKSSVVISEGMAVRLFRTPENAFGKTITQVYGKELKEVKVAGVFREQPMNSSFYKRDGSSFMNFENCKDEYPNMREDDWTMEASLFVQINDPTRVSSVQKQLLSYTDNHNKVREDFQIRRQHGLHLPCRPSLAP
jgi:putative ABC transport system permease protein